MDDEPVLKKIDLLGVHVISLVDRLCYLAPFNCRSTLEDKVHIDHRRLMERQIQSIFETDDACEEGLKAQLAGTEVSRLGSVVAMTTQAGFALERASMARWASDGRSGRHGKATENLKTGQSNDR